MKFLLPKNLLKSPPHGSTQRAAWLAVWLGSATLAFAQFSVRDYGAKGDGHTLDTDAINRTIEAASKAGGGTVVIPAGTYLSFSIRLKSNITLSLEPGSTVVAAEPPASGGKGYDAPEANDEGESYVDFGHSHWRNSLIWGDGLENVSIIGSGIIYGRGLSIGKGNHVRDVAPDERKAGKGNASPQFAEVTVVTKKDSRFKRNPKEILPDGIGNKSIALRNCRNVTLRDFTILHGGHFGILATGVDNFIVQNLTIDTNRDGMDLDACRNLRVTDCVVNSPYDDAIVLKSSYALGLLRATENVSIANCHVSGYVEGTLLDGRRVRFKDDEKGRPNFGPCGRIKCGTESNGGFKNIAITNCVFDYCRGLAFEMVDGGPLEDVVVSNITMRDLCNPPIYIRLGNRGRGPEGTAVGTLRRVRMNHIVAYAPTSTSGILIDGLVGHPVEDISLTDMLIVYKGTGTAEQAARVVPEFDKLYPEPARWGILPAWGLWARHVSNLQIDNVELRALAPDLRAPIALMDAAEVHLSAIKATRQDGVPAVTTKDARLLTMHEVAGLPETKPEDAVSSRTYE